VISTERVERARPFLEAALEYTQGTHTYADVVQDLDTGKSQLWDTDQAAVVTEIHVSPRAKTCHLFLAGGDLNELERILRVIERWAKSEGCTRMSLAGRRGWERTFLRGEGYAPAWTVMTKELES
jgi:hypothetical protein